MGDGKHHMLETSQNTELPTSQALEENPSMHLQWGTS